MSKKNPEEKAPVAAASASTPVAAADAIVVGTPVTETALAPTAPADPGLAELSAKLPPSHRTAMARFTRPSSEAVEAAMAALSATERDQLVDLVDKLQSQPDFKPTAVKVFHGIGNDPQRPEKLLPGSFYSAGSVDLGSEMVIAVLKVWDTRVLWPPQDAENKSPVCSSPDGKAGDRFGDCGQCPNLKKKYTEGGCTPQVTMWFTDEAFSGIYEFTFSKTALKSGLAAKNIAGADKKTWFRWMTFKAEERKEGDKRWYVPKISPVQNLKDPTKNVTSVPLRDLFKLLDAQMALDVYFPRVARSYNRNDDSNGGGAATDNGGAGSPLKADTSDGDFGGANTGL